MTFKEFVKKHSITAHIIPADLTASDYADKWKSTSNKWEVCLSLDSKRHTTNYYTGSAITEEPEAHDILQSLQLDYLSTCYPSFDDWCNDYGYNNDSIKALNTFEQSVKESAKLKDFFSIRQLVEFLDCTEEE